MKTRTLLLFILTLLSLNVCAAEQTASHQCGDAEVLIKAQDRAEDNYPGFNEVNITVIKGKEQLTIKEENDFFIISCLQGKKNTNLIVYQSYCSGSGCKDLDNYGIIDTQELKILLKPSDDNRKKAGRLVGISPEQLNEKIIKNAFSLSNLSNGQ